ncbi:hypothetical protein [Pseudoalteromonas sp. Q18-MNA-CIBAN-0097]|uniref:hypothetical protein n=1 Tax=Pseudoalteromonas sp. Q18-MNA-CIBAN-0097 TaxID=3140440 RepID=UPI00331EB156
MSRLLKYEKKSHTSQKDPIWLAIASPVQKRLYLEAKKQFEKKKADIESGKASNGKDRKLVASEIAVAAKCDKSNISKRKNADLHKWIEEHTKELLALSQSRGISSVSRRKTTEEVRKENQQIKQQLKAEINYDYVSISEALLANTLIESQKNISYELSELRQENQYLLNQVAELRQANRLLMNSINVGTKNG